MTTGPWIVLEGPDGGGKSTLAERLVSQAGYDLAHCGPPEKPAFEFYADALREHPGPTVFDRLHVGSYVYGRAFRGRDDMSMHERWLMDGLLWRNDTLMVVARPPDWRLDQSLERGPDNADAQVYEDPARRALVRQLYDDIVAERGERVVDLPTFVYDFTSDAQGLEATIVRIRGWLRSRHVAGEGLIPDDIPAIGNVRNPKYVFVGEQPHCRAKILQRARAKKLDVTRYVEIAHMMERLSPPVVFNSLSGRYLQQALGSLSLSDYCIFNALQLDGTQLSDFVRPPQVTRLLDEGAEFVALGAVASKELTRAGIVHRQAPHPQWVKRFKYKEGQSRYPKVLLGTAPAWSREEATSW